MGPRMTFTMGERAFPHRPTVGRKEPKLAGGVRCRIVAWLQADPFGAGRPPPPCWSDLQARRPVTAVSSSPQSLSQLCPQAPYERRGHLEGGWHLLGPGGASAAPRDSGHLCTVPWCGQDEVGFWVTGLGKGALHRLGHESGL